MHFWIIRLNSGIFWRTMSYLVTSFWHINTPECWFICFILFKTWRGVRIYVHPVFVGLVSPRYVLSLRMRLIVKEELKSQYKNQLWQFVDRPATGREWNQRPPIQELYSMYWCSLIKHRTSLNDRTGGQKNNKNAIIIWKNLCTCFIVLMNNKFL